MKFPQPFTLKLTETQINIKCKIGKKITCNLNFINILLSLVLRWIPKFWEAIEVSSSTNAFFAEKVPLFNNSSM